MDSHHYACIKLFTFSLPVFCLFSWSWAAASTTTTPPSSALLAVDILHNRGYSIFASMLGSLSDTNFTGTLLVPPDFAFSFATAMFLNNRRPPPRPSVSLLLYHTIKSPPILMYSALSSRDDGNAVGTLYNNNCLYLFQGPYRGEISISSSPIKNPRVAVKIRQPDLYVDDNLTVHGIDGVLDPSFATECSAPDSDPTLNAVPPSSNPSFLEHAMRALRRRGYNVVAAAMAIRTSELLYLTSVTVFAVPDEKLFLRPGGFRYDFRHHVLPMRRRFADLAQSTTSGMELDSLAPNKAVLVNSVDGAVTVDGIAVNPTEVYRNRWIVVLSVMTSLDDAFDSRENQPINGTFPISGIFAPSPAPLPGVSESGNIPRVPSPAPPYVETPISSRSPVIENTSGSPPPAYIGNTTSSPSPSYTENTISSPSPAYTENTISSSPFPAYIGNTISSPSPAPWIDSVKSSVSSPTPSPANDDDVPHCDGGVFVGLEGADLFCPVSSTVRQLQETEISSNLHVAESKPSDAYTLDTDESTQSDKVKIVENVNIADDLFYYV